MDDRKATLETLVELATAEEDDQCWHHRAERLLRTQSSPAEFRELGISEELLKKIWPDE